MFYLSDFQRFKEADEDAPWQVKLKNVKKDEVEVKPEKSPAPEAKEVERLQYIPAPKRERPEVSRPIYLYVIITINEIISTCSGTLKDIEFELLFVCLFLTRAPEQ